jgi:hypothetical protein
MQTITELADQLTPFWQRDLDALRAELSGTFAAAGGGGGTESVSRHDFLGAYHELPTVSAGAVLIGPELSSGLPAFRSLTITDINAALASRSVGAGSGISGGGNLGADVTVSVNQGFPFAWTATHTYTSAARAIGASGGWQYDDRTTSGAANRWTVYANSNISRWMYNATDQMWLTSTGVLRSPGYVSQTTGAAVEFATGAADFRYLFTDELHAKAFIADLEQALAGGQIISKSVTILYLAFTAPAAGASTTLTVRDLPSATGMAVFQNSDFIRVRNFSRSGGSLTIGDCWGTVTLDTSYGVSGFDSATKTQRYTFTRSSGADAGAMTAGTVVAADAIILDYGTAGNGIHEINAIDGVYAANSPYARIATWATHPRTMTERTRVGKLTGITSTANEFGFYAGDGGIADTNKYVRISTQDTRLNNLDFNIFNAGTRVFRVDAATPYLALGNPNPTGFLTGTGFWVGKDGSSYKFQVGSASGGALTDGLSWNGTALAMRMAGSSVFVDADGMRLKLPSGSSLTYVPQSSIEWSSTPETAGTSNIAIQAARSTGGVWPANSLNISVSDTGAGRQAIAGIGASNTTGGGAASLGLFSQGDGVDYAVLSADRFDIAAAVNMGSATGAVYGGISGKNAANSGLLWVVDSGLSSAQSAGITFADRGTAEWSLYKDSSNNLAILEEGGAVRALFNSGGGLNMGTAGGATVGGVRGRNSADAGLLWFIDSGASAAQSAGFTLADRGTAKWSVYKDSSNELSFLEEGAAVRMTLKNGGAVHVPGSVGVGTATTQAKLHTYDTDGGTLHNWRTTGIGATRVTIIPNGTGDCTQACAVFGVAHDSSGNSWELRGALESGVSAGSEQTVQVAGDATDNLHVKVKTDGQIEIVRNAGSRTWSVCLSAWWR